MASYEDWNKLEGEEEEEELQDLSWFEGRRDVILFCIDCSESMLELRDDQNYENVKTCHLLTALEGAMQIQKKKVIVGPNDAVGILLFNTEAKNERTGQVSEIKRNTYVLQPIETINAPKIQDLMLLIDAARQDPDHLRKAFPPLERSQVPLGDVFTSCNWVIRDGAPKTATKRVFLVTDQDDPHPGKGTKQLITSARTTLIDLIQAGVTVEPFFISSDEKSFDPSKFYSSVLLPDSFDQNENEESSSILPESISISRIDDLLSQMRFREIPKRSQFNIPFELYNGFVIGVKGYGLVTEQKKGTYKYFMDLGDRMGVANVRTSYVDEDRETEAEKPQILYGVDLGATADVNDAPDDDDNDGGGVGVPGFGVRTVEKDSRPFYTADEVRSFRTLNLEPGIKLLGFKDRGELLFEDNIKHSTFIYPDEFTYSGSKRTFSALIKSMIKKKKIGLVLTLLRRSSSPVFCALLPQEEHVEEGGWNEPSGFHLIPLPFADDIRSATVDEAFRASESLAEAAETWIKKLSLKNESGYPPDSYPNPALAYHNAQLEASAFREEFNEDEFEDLTAPKLDMIHKRAGDLLREWRGLVANDESAHTFIAATGSKRKADVSVDEAEIRSMYDAGKLEKLKVEQLKTFLRSKSENVFGKKSDLVERIGNWFNMHQ